MAELTPTDKSFFERLGNVLHDPLVERMMWRARECAAAINETDATDDERNVLMAELDREWIYMDQPLIVSGYIWMMTPAQPTPQRVYQSDLSAISQGFTFDPDRISVGDETIHGAYNAALLLAIDDPEVDGQKVYAALHLDDIEHVDYPFPSPEFRKQRFRYHFEREADEIDDAYLGSKTDAEMIDMLKNFYFDANMSDPDDQQWVLDAQAYLNHILDLDKALPYTILAIGSMAVTAEQGTLTSVQSAKFDAQLVHFSRPTRRLIEIRRVLLQPDNLSEGSARGSHRFVPYLDGISHGKDRARGARRVLIPFSSILHVESIRNSLD